MEVHERNSSGVHHGSVHSVVAGNAVALDYQSVAEERMEVVEGAHSSEGDVEEEVLVLGDEIVGDGVVEEAGNDEEEGAGNDYYKGVVGSLVAGVLALVVVDSFLWQGSRGLAMTDWPKRWVRMGLNLDPVPFGSRSVGVDVGNDDAGKIEAGNLEYLDSLVT